MRKPGEKKDAWRKLQEDKNNCSNQNKAWSHWHISLTFLSLWHLHKPCCCSVPLALGPRWLMATKSGLHMPRWHLCSLCFYLSNPNLSNIPVITLNPRNCRLKRRGERLGNILSSLHPAITAHNTSHHHPEHSSCPHINCELKTLLSSQMFLTSYAPPPPFSFRG